LSISADPTQELPPAFTTMADLAARALEEIRSIPADDLPAERLPSGTVLAYARAHGAPIPDDLGRSRARRRRVQRLSRTAYRTWATRYEIEHGLRDLPDVVDLTQIPIGRTEDERVYIRGVVLLIQCRHGWAPDNSLALDRRFMSAWTGLPENVCRRVLNDLIERGWIFVTGKGVNLKGLRLFLLQGMSRLLSLPVLRAPRAIRSTATALGGTTRGRDDWLTLQEVLQRARKPRQRGAEWSACCPAHDDHNPSLSIRAGERFPFVAYCHAGCTFREILAAFKRARPRYINPAYLGKAWPPGRARQESDREAYVAQVAGVHAASHESDQRERRRTSWMRQRTIEAVLATKR
jgi:hypothetical protein